jgi:hypothetical protein
MEADRDKSEAQVAEVSISLVENELSVVYLDNNLYFGHFYTVL